MHLTNVSLIHSSCLQPAGLYIIIIIIIISTTRRPTMRDSGDEKGRPTAPLLISPASLVQQQPRPRRALTAPSRHVSWGYTPGEVDARDGQDAGRGRAAVPDTRRATSRTWRDGEQSSAGEGGGWYGTRRYCTHLFNAAPSGSVGESVCLALIASNGRRMGACLVIRCRAGLLASATVATGAEHYRRPGAATA